MFVDEAEMSSGTVIDKLDSGDRRLGTSIVLTRYNSVACYRIGVQPYFAREVSELESNADLHIEEVVSALMEAVAMEAAAEIRETSADGCGANCCWHRCF